MSLIERMREDDWPGSRLSGNDLWALVISRALCSRGDVDPDQWYPVSATAPAARREAAQAIALCSGCLVRVHCLELSLRYWTVGQHGIWGGTVPAEREVLRRELAEREVLLGEARRRGCVRRPRGLVSGRRAPRDWWPGRYFGCRLTRFAQVPRPAPPLYTLGTAARIERIRLIYLRGDFPGYPERVVASPGGATSTSGGSGPR